MTAERIEKMELDIIHWKEGERPPVQLPDPRFLETLGEEGMRKLISDQYNLLVKSNIKNLFPSDREELELAKKRAGDFFIQICGGPPYYKENRGLPMMTKRHEPFEITAKGRETWLGCYQEILPKLEQPKSLILSFWNYLNVFSLWMVNSPKTNPLQNLKFDA